MLSHGGRLRLGSYYGQGQGGQHAGSEEVVRSGYVPTRSAVRSGNVPRGRIRSDMQIVELTHRLDTF